MPDPAQKIWLDQIWSGPMTSQGPTLVSYPPLSPLVSNQTNFSLNFKRISSKKFTLLYPTEPIKSSYQQIFKDFEKWLTNSIIWHGFQLTGGFNWVIIGFKKVFYSTWIDDMRKGLWNFLQRQGVNFWSIKCYCPVIHLLTVLLIHSDFFSLTADNRQLWGLCLPFFDAANKNKQTVKIFSRLRARFFRIVEGGAQFLISRRAVPHVDQENENKGKNFPNRQNHQANQDVRNNPRLILTSYIHSCCQRF